MPSVYKYTHYRKEFFDNFYLKISQFGEFNDPFEMVMGNYLSSVTQEEHDEIISLSSRLSDGATYIDAAFEAQCGVRASVGVLCFASKNDNLLMWAHYANNHSGICIEFDREANFFNGKYKDFPPTIFGNTNSESSYKDCYENIGTLRKVKYQIERPTYIELHELECDTESWFIKSPEWEYEEEWRLLLPDDHAQKVEGSKLLFYPVDPKIIKSIIIGCQMSIEQKCELYAKCNEHGIPVKEAFIHSHKFELDIVDYNEENHQKYRNIYNLNRITN